MADKIKGLWVTFKQALAVLSCEKYDFQKIKEKAPHIVPIGILCQAAILDAKKAGKHPASFIQQTLKEHSESVKESAFINGQALSDLIGNLQVLRNDKEKAKLYEKAHTEKGFATFAPKLSL
jgi:hypothetical protein